MNTLSESDMDILNPVKHILVMPDRRSRLFSTLLSVCFLSQKPHTDTSRFRINFNAACCCAKLQRDSYRPPHFFFYQKEENMDRVRAWITQHFSQSEISIISGMDDYKWVWSGILISDQKGEVTKFFLPSTPL